MKRQEIWEAKLVRPFTDMESAEVVLLNKYTVVYKNSTYYYCKVNGCDELKQIPRDVLYRWIPGNICQYAFENETFAELLNIHKAKLQLTYFTVTHKKLLALIYEKESAMATLAHEISLAAMEVDEVESKIVELIQKYPELRNEVER